MSAQDGLGYGPITSVDGGSTGPGIWVRPQAAILTAWAYHVKTGNSTSAVTVKHLLQGTLSLSSAPGTADVFTLSTGSGAGVVIATGKPVAQVRAVITHITSTTSTAPTATVAVVGAP